jgi:hypothetical protein
MRKITLCTVSLFLSISIGFSQKSVKIHEDSDQRVLYSEIFSSSRIVKLETNPNCLISNIGDIRIDDNKMFISDLRQGFILIFDMDGKFITKFGRKGKGPGELIEPRGFFLDKKNKLIGIQDAFQRKILYYSYDGTYLKSNPSLWVLHVENRSDSYFLGYGCNYPIASTSGKIEADIVVFNNEGIVVKKFDIYSLPHRIGLGSSSNMTVDTNSNAFIVPMFENSLFRIDKDINCRKIANFNFDTKIPKDIFDDSKDIDEIAREFSKRNCPFLITGMKISNGLLTFVFSYKRMGYLSFWRIGSDEAITVKKRNFTNDLSGFVSSSFSSVFDDGFISVVEATDVKEMFDKENAKSDPFSFVKNIQDRKEVISIGNSTGIDDNPIIILNTIKK